MTWPAFLWLDPLSTCHGCIAAVTVDLTRHLVTWSFTHLSWLYYCSHRWLDCYLVTWSFIYLSWLYCCSHSWLDPPSGDMLLHYRVTQHTGRPYKMTLLYIFLSHFLYTCIHIHKFVYTIYTHIYDVYIHTYIYLSI